MIIYFCNSKLSYTALYCTNSAYIVLTVGYDNKQVKGDNSYYFSKRNIFNPIDNEYTKT